MAIYVPLEFWIFLKLSQKRIFRNSQKPCSQLAQLRKKFDTSESAVRGQMKKIRELELQLADSKAMAATAEKARDKAILNGRKLRSEKAKRVNNF